MLILISRKMFSLWSVLLAELLAVYLPLVCVGEDPEIHYSPYQLIASKGYPAEDHWVTTQDGYILNLQRIPHGIHKNGSGPVVFLQHGVLGASTNWITNLANESLAFILADAGFDVWLGNVRGNTYSKNHTHLKPSSKEFWDFSFDEHIKYDLPAMLNYALSVSGKDELSYIGHSQGTAMGFGGFTSNPELAEKVNLFVTLAPVANVSHCEGAFKILADLFKEEDIVLKVFGVKDLLPSDELMHILASVVCPVPGLKDICGNVLFLIGGYDVKNMNYSRVAVYAGHSPAGTSVKNMNHWSQLVHSGRFAMYDYGSAKKNEEHYGQPSAPDYDVSKLSVPTATFTGGHDWLADPTDVASLLPTIPHLVYKLNISYYEHLDFIWGLDSGYVVYPHVVSLLSRHNL